MSMLVVRFCMATKERLKIRKNFLPTVLVTLFLWICWGIIFFFVPPEYLLMPFVFILITFFAVLFPAALIFAHTRRGLFSAFYVVLIMSLNYIGIGNILNFFLLLSLFVALEYYLSQKQN
jgi:hypothetical protein